MRNEWTTIRLYDKVSGALLDKKIAMGVPMVKADASGKMVTSTADRWMHYEEFAFERRWSEYKNNALAYSVSNRNMNGEYMNFGKSGEVIRQGDGLYAQMARGNVYYYNKFSLKFLEEALTAFFAGRVDMNNREVLMRTGEFGALEFSRAARNAASGWTEFEWSGDNLGLLEKKGEGKYKLTNPQIVEYLSPNNVRFKVEIDPSYDDPYQNKVTHPEGGLVQSRRFDIFDLGSMDQPNIFKTAIKGKPEYRGYQWGLRNPWTGAMNNENMSYDEDSASFHRMTTMGLCILDPTRVMSFVPMIDNE